MTRALRLRLNFATPQAPVVLRSTFQGWLLLAAALAASGYVFVHHRALTLDIEAIEMRSDRLRRAEVSAPREAPVASESLAAQVRAVNRAIERLAVPWSSLFKALEAAKTDRIFILTLQPNVQRREVRIVGEAAEFAAITEYVNALSAANGVHDARLATHELRADGQIYFEILAAWKVTP